MAADDSLLDLEALARARGLLAPGARRQRMWPVLAAAAALAVSALAFATAMIVAPPLVTYSVAQTAPG
ncbi:hypothetical protein LRS10_16615 [Phenylobacterium sp. J426]|uniref:hypothetical protein n=1 Tax=Phenylobacterium sp. J426 TaxID=2898439 RepID=UPI002150CE5C|nr:hypothetical protein [Phenylobacterium sp. J426]MCR5875649.1 hypothetical protein [Phenylobacterium sp. J426]